MEIIHTTTKDSISMPTLASDTVAHSLADERKQNVDSGYYSCSNVDESKLYDNPNMQKETLQNPKLLENFHRSPNHEKTLLNGRHTTIDVHSTGLYSTNGFTRMGNDNMVDGNGNHINRLNLKASSDGSDSGLENDCQKMIPTCKTCPTCATMCLTSNSIVHLATDNRHSYNKDIITTATMTSQSNSISRPKEKLDLAAQDLAMKIEFCLKFGYTVNQIRAALSKLSYKATKNDILGELFKFSTAQSVGHIPHGHTSLPAHVDIDPQFPYLDKDYQSVNVQPGELVSHGISTSQSMLHARGPSTLEHGTKSSKESDDSENLRPIVIDGSNVAMSHGNKQYFSCKGIAIAVDHFRMRNHRDITVFIPTYRKESSRPDAPIKDREILDKLEQERILVYTPSRCINGKRVTCYDDRFILRLAQDTDGVIVSNDNFRDLQNEKPEWKELIEKRLLMYSFVNDLFMPPDDPLGRNGPSLDNFLRKRPASEEQSKPQCPYGKKCTYGKKCKYFHPECAYSHKSVTDRLKEKTERRLKASNVAHSLAEEIVNSPKSIVTDQGPPQPNAAENETKNLHEQVSLGPRVQMEPQGTPNSSNCASYPQPVDLAEQLKQQAVISTPSPTHLPGPKSTPQYSPAVSQPPPGPHNHIFMNPNPCLEPRNKMLSSPAAFTGYENNSSHQVYYNMSHPTPFQQMAPQSYIQYHQVPYHDLHYPSPHQRVMYSYPNMQLPPNMMPPRMYIAPNPNSDGSAFSHSYPLLPSPERGLIHIQPHVRTCHTDSDPKTYPPRTTRRAVSSPHHPCDMGAQNQPALPLDSPQNPRYNLFKNLCGLFPRITVEKVMHSNPDISLPKELIKMCLEESS